MQATNEVLGTDTVPAKRIRRKRTRKGVRVSRGIASISRYELDSVVRAVTGDLGTFYSSKIEGLTQAIANATERFAAGVAAGDMTNAMSIGAEVLALRNVLDRTIAQRDAAVPSELALTEATLRAAQMVSYIVRSGMAGERDDKAKLAKLGEVDNEVFNGAVVAFLNAVRMEVPTVGKR